MERLPPSLDAEAIDPVEAIVLPESQTLPWTFAGRGRGLLLLISVLGLCAFFLPWVEIRMPESAIRSGFDLARGRAGWLWGGAAGWLVLVPLVGTRRTVTGMRGVRAICVALAALTLVETSMLFLLPPHSRQHVPVEIAWRWGLYTSALLSLLGAFAAMRFGGSLRDLPSVVRDAKSSDPDETSHGETLH
jgi:hypothetical protein